MRTALHRRAALLLAACLAAAVGLSPGPSAAVNTDLPGRLVSTNPVDFTPHVMNGSVNAITQVGNKIVAAGTFTKVSPANTFSTTGDDLVRNGIFAFDATTGALDASFNPNLGGAANSLDTDGTSVYVAGSFSSVGGNTAYKRVVKLTAAGTLDLTFKATPSAVVNEVVVRSGRVYIGGSFTSVKSRLVTTDRSALAALDPSTGAVLSAVNVPFTGVYDTAIGGVTGIKRLDVTPDGSRLVAIGNFSTVGAATRSQIAVLDTPANGNAGVSAWATNRFDANHNDCAGVFDTFTRDIDISPDGSYFVTSTTGAFAGGSGSGTMCDSTSRWQLASTGNDPEWVSYTGGDTTYGVAVTGGAVYVGGHMRWQNNSFQGDQAGPGAVARAGIAALDPANGLPLSWNPGRTRGVGAQAMYATSTGLWVGSDTTVIGKETHGRVAMLPVTGGTGIPPVAASTLPNNLWGAQRSSGAASNVLYRVSAAGPALQALDGPDWTTDAGYVSGGGSADWGSTVPRDSTVPAGTAPDLFATERYGSQDWNFPVTSGANLTVRLFFANQYGGTAQPGQRVFDVLVDGTNVLPGFDIAAAAGDRKGTMRAVTVTGDANGLDIDLRSVTENPLINGIEILDNSAGTVTATSGVLQKRAVDASGVPTAAPTTANSTIDWSTLRGAFLVNSTLFYGLPDGGLYSRTFTKATGAVSAPTTVNLYDDPETGQRIPFPIANVTGMFYEPTKHRLYYTVFGNSALYYRYFTPQSQVVGADTFTATANGVDFATTAGMTLAGGRILYGSSVDGSLRSVAFAGGAVTGSPALISSDGTWKYRAMFAPSS